MNINALRRVIPSGFEPETHSLEGCFGGLETY